MAALPADGRSGQDGAIKDVGHVAAQKHIVSDQSGKKGEGGQHQRQPAAFAFLAIWNRPELKQGPGCDRRPIEQAQEPGRKRC